jgi:hypothetical protein
MSLNNERCIMSVFLVDYSDFKDWIKANNYEEKEYDLDQESDGKHGTNVFWHIKKKMKIYTQVSLLMTHMEMAMLIMK